MSEILDPTQNYRVSPWKHLALILCGVFFILTLISYLRGDLPESGRWLWPMLFVPLFLFLLSIIYGDIPAQYYREEVAKAIPKASSKQLDRSVVAVILLFLGLVINCLLLAYSLWLDPLSFVTLLYAVYLAIMLFELPNSVKIFKFLQSLH
ncbi:MAG: hypothetical protein EA425_01845 [Puniceicoccaceae bacterium]|nr:MAG: hypothetical protein EA425_01845 [Puniceicoccaceae bacterium]